MERKETKTDLNLLREELKDIKNHKDLESVIISEFNKLGYWCSRTIDFDRVLTFIKTLKRHQPNYRKFKDLGLEQGWWKNRKRGDPEKGFREGMGKSKN